MNIARIYVNNIEVGSLPIAQYDDIVRNSMKDYRLYILQAWVILKGAFNLAIRSFQAISVGALFFATLLIVFFPDDFIGIVEVAGTVSINEIVYGARNAIFPLWFALFVLSACFACMNRKPAFGIYNCFWANVSYELRRLLEVPTEGEIDVVRVEKINEQQ